MTGGGALPPLRASRCTLDSLRHRGRPAGRDTAPAGRGVNERFLSMDLDTAAMATRFESEGGD